MPSNQTNNNSDPANSPAENTNSNHSQKTDTNTNTDTLNLDDLDVDLDWQSTRVLTVLTECNGHSNTREITDKTGLENHVVNYRFQKLGENGHGLLTTYHPSRDAGGRTPPKTVELTELGHTAIEAGLLEETTEETTLESTVKKLEAHNHELETKTEHLENVLDEVVEDMVMLRKGFIMVENALSEQLDEDEELTDYLPDDVPVAKTDYSEGDSA